MEKKPIKKGYVQLNSQGHFILYTQSGNALPVYDSQHDSYLSASKEAERLECSTCRMVQPSE